MKIKYILFTIIFACSLTSFSFGQKTSKTIDKLPSIGIHFGTLSYLGDIQGSKGSSMFTYWRPAYGFYLEKKIGSYFGVSANGMFGKVSKSQLDNNVFLNFETSITNVDVNLLFDFDNGKIIHKSSLFTPYISVGFGFLSFNPKGDLYNNGVLYNHWSDGTLRNIAENVPGADTASVILKRDYTYESTLTDSTNNYSRTTFTVPLRFGLKFELSKNVAVRISAAYILTFTDYIDNYAVGGNDKLFYTSFGVQYNFAEAGGNNEYKDFDFSSLDKADADGDGVNDTKDACQNTPKGVKVDSKGCPLDADKDGVPDYLDKEPNTPEGTLVNADGVTLTDAMIELQEKMKDSVEVKRTAFKADDLSQEEIDAIQKQYDEANNAKNSENSTPMSGIKIPEKFKTLDLNNDAYISAKEVTGAIDQFFEGENNLTTKDLHDLIDFYFDQ